MTAERTTTKVEQDKLVAGSSVHDACGATLREKMVLRSGSNNMLVHAGDLGARIEFALYCPNCPSATIEIGSQQLS